MQVAGATALAIDARRTLLIDRVKMIEAADAAGIAIQAFEPESDASASRAGAALRPGADA